MKGYKGFNKGMICLGKQYAQNTVFEEPEANICESGMHFCENPFDVLDYYSFVNDDGELNEFAEVEALDEVETNDDRKFCTKKLKIGAKLSLIGFVKACENFVIEKETVAQAIDAIASTGDCSTIASTGDKSEVAITGFNSKVASTGDCFKVASTGNYSEIVSTGDDSQIVSTGRYSTVVSTGESCVICCTGINPRARAKKDSWITLGEWKWSEEKKDYIPVCVKTERVDGEHIKEDVFYTLRDGEFQEVV